MAINVSSQNEKINLNRILKENLDLVSFSTIRVHSVARYAAFPTELGEIRALLSWARGKNIPTAILGGGSNTLAGDDGVDGLLIITTGMTHFHINGEMFCVRCGLTLESAIDHASEAGLAGLEMLGGIPGTVGGAIWGNAGVDAAQISTTLYYVDYLTMDGKLHRMQIHADDFSYRHSPFMDMQPVILYEAAFRLTPTRQTAQLRIIKEGTKARRREQHQYDCPNLGCFFKNPQGQVAGTLIEEAGLKGKKIGGAMVSPYHANFIVNTDGTATGGDVRSLSELVQRTVKERTGVELQYEITFLGSWKKRT